MARTWLSIRVDLVEGHARPLWPRPGRVLLARPGMTFRMLADAINDAFARWDLSHLHAFTLADGTRITIKGPWDDDWNEAELDDTREKLTRLSLGEQFVYEFDIGDGWMHLCTVADEKVDPHEVYGEAPDRPAEYFGWGAIPDQYDRRWDGDDGQSPPPLAPDPPLSDLPDLHPGWGRDAQSVSDGSEFGGFDDGVLVPGPWFGRGGEPGGREHQPWVGESVQQLRGAVRRNEAVAVVDLLTGRDPFAVAHLAGPGLIHAVEVGHDPAGVIVHRLLPRLRDRGWLGDDELADELERAVRDEPSPLRPTPVELDELASHLEGPTDFYGGWKLEIATGDLWPNDPEGIAGIERPDDFDDPDAFVGVVALGSKPGYRDMEDFITTVTDERLAERLGVAIQGKGAFRRFRDTLYEDEFWWDVWLTYSSERQLARARWWLADIGLRPAAIGD